MKPGKLSQRASRDEEEGKEEENKDKIEREMRSLTDSSSEPALYSSIYFASAHNLSA
jgi:hypothetical protein